MQQVNTLPHFEALLAGASRLLTIDGVVTVMCLLGCPIDIICNRGAGSALLKKPRRLQEVVQATAAATSKPVIVKIR
jgi:tRNA-dihydrouridine synthase